MRHISFVFRQPTEDTLKEYLSIFSAYDTGATFLVAPGLIKDWKPWRRIEATPSEIGCRNYMGDRPQESHPEHWQMIDTSQRCLQRQVGLQAGLVFGDLLAPAGMGLVKYLSRRFDVIECSGSFDNRATRSHTRLYFSHPADSDLASLLSSWSVDPSTQHDWLILSHTPALDTLTLQRSLNYLRALDDICIDTLSGVSRLLT